MLKQHNKYVNNQKQTDFGFLYVPAELKYNHDKQISIFNWVDFSYL